MELSGPLDHQSWAECCRLLITGLVGVEAVELGPVLDYKIMDYADRYGQLTWPLLHQSDVRCRFGAHGAAQTDTRSGMQ